MQEVRDGSIRFDHVTFKYKHGSGQPVLNDITFDIKPGEGMWAMMKKMTPEVMAGMISIMPDGFIESLNAKLIKIKK